MGVRIIEETISDVSGKEDAKTYNILIAPRSVDLTDEEAPELEAALAVVRRFADAGRPYEGIRWTHGTATDTKTAKATKTAKDGLQPWEREAKRHRDDAIRAWGNANGFTVSDRGRIKQEVVDAYDRAQEAPEAPAPAPELAPVTELAGKPAGERVMVTQTRGKTAKPAVLLHRNGAKATVQYDDDDQPTTVPGRRVYTPGTVEPPAEVAPAVVEAPAAVFQAPQEPATEAPKAPRAPRKAASTAKAGDPDNVVVDMAGRGRKATGSKTSATKATRTPRKATA